MNLEEKVLSEEIFFKGHVIEVAKETVELPNGEQSTREIVHHHGAVGIFAVTDEDKIVLVNQWRAPIRKTSLEIPAGKIDGEDHDLMETAMRELNEETRYKAKKITKIYGFHSAVGFADEYLTLYHATGLVNVKTELPQDADEFLNLIELTFDEVQDKIKSGKITDVKTILAVAYWEIQRLKGELHG
ncbi:NUDIX domain-containing protein [Dellaglioa algida]|uniref:NUDIX domain-containing protein n=1 Tax=Dellaglioa algida TaxID=105612 RepID=UPI0024C49C3F|nr:NUDIX hydrolase [Dellaglioa algida]MDK1726181.1 NUDIX hydrolase [Dellaglioa algida]